jgi:hypothetical protein
MKSTLKREGTGLAIRIFQGKKGETYLVLRSPKGSYHVFAEVEAKEAAMRCGAVRPRRPPQTLWSELWRRGV